MYPNHIIVKPTDTSHQSFGLWTQQFQGPNSENNRAILADVYYTNQTFLNNATLYWDKIYDLMGRPMSVATVTYIPYSITDYVVSYCCGFWCQYAKHVNLCGVAV